MNTLSDPLTSAFTLYAARRRLTTKSQRHYVLTNKRFSEFLNRQIEASDYNDDTVSAFVLHRIEQGRSAHTVKVELARILAFWKFCFQRKLVEPWPQIERMKVPKRTPKAWTQEELQRLFSATQHAASVGSTDGPLWWLTLFSVLWDTGERIGAVMQLTWQHVDLTHNRINLTAEWRKGGRTDANFPISVETVALLKQLPRHARVFHFPYDQQTLYNRFNRLLKAAGLPTDRRSKFHRIRRSTASHYEAAGGDATELLGHSSRAVTRGYLDPRIVKPVSAVDLLFRPGSA